MNSSTNRHLWSKILAGKTPGTMPVDPNFWKLFKKYDHILEVGCGWGRIIYECLAHELYATGIDINKQEIALLKDQLAKDRLSDFAKIYKQSVLKMSFPNKSFDGATMLGVLGALAKEQRSLSLKEVYRVLKPKAYLYISEFEINLRDEKYISRYNRDYLTTGEYGTFCVRNDDGRELFRTHNFSKSEIGLLLSSCGFIIRNFERQTFISYRGNRKPGMLIIAQKIK